MLERLVVRHGATDRADDCLRTERRPEANLVDHGLRAFGQQKVTQQLALRVVETLLQQMPFICEMPTQEGDLSRRHDTV